MIKAEAHSDDHNLEVEFDATPWFQQTSNLAILRLAECGWGGDYPADDVAIESADMDPRLAELFRYLEIIADDPLKKDCGGFECHVDAKSALAWLAGHRPVLLPAIAAVTDAENPQDADAVAAALPTRKFSVRLARTETRCYRLEVQADTEAHARALAMEGVDSLDFHEGVCGLPEYGIDEIEEVNP